jgi:hypothetical protein
MGKNISIFTGAQDDRDLRQYIRSVGLHLVPLRVDLDPALVEDPGSYTGWFISFLPPDQLHPYGASPVRIGPATDPLIDFTRSYYAPPYLIAGRLYWHGGNNEFARLTAPYFRILGSWVRRHWRRRPEDGFYIGPDAERLVREEGAQLAYLPPGTPIEIIKIP